MNRQLAIVNNGRTLITYTNISGRYSTSPPITLCETVKVTRFTGCKNILVVVSTLETEPCSIHHGLIVDMIASVIANIFRKDLISFFLRVRYVPINKKIAEEHVMIIGKIGSSVVIRLKVLSLITLIFLSLIKFSSR